MVVAVMLLSLLLVAVVVLYVHVARRWYDRERRLCYARRLRGLCDTEEGVGCSLLVRHPHSGASLSRHLCVELTAYEVVAVVDGAEEPELLAQLCEDFALRELPYAPHLSLPAYGVRGLYRSQREAFRRLQVVDRVSSTPQDDLTVAASVARYRWLVPLAHDVALRPGAIEELWVAAQQPHRLARRRIRSADGVSMVACEEVVAARGFGRSLVRRVRRKTLTLWSLRAKVSPVVEIFRKSAIIS